MSQSRTPNIYLYILTKRYMREMETDRASRKNKR